MAMAYLDEEDVWRCATHPSERRRHGVCPLCLRDKLTNLCPNCASIRPCGCPGQPEPILKRSRSLALSLLRSKTTQKTATHSDELQSSSLSFWSKMKTKKKAEKDERSDKDNKMGRSKSVGMALFSRFGSFRKGGCGSGAMEKSSKRWFVSPIRSSKQSKPAKVNHDNSPNV